MAADVTHEPVQENDECSRWDHRRFERTKGRNRMDSAPRVTGITGSFEEHA